MGIYLLSIKPYFARQIYCGIKKYELRRKTGKIIPNSILIIYESNPVKAVTGLIKIGEVKVLPSKKVESLIVNGMLEGCGIEDIEYIKGRKSVLILKIEKRSRLENPITLNELREIIPGFKPPLSYFRIDNKERYKRLINMVKSSI